MARQSRQSLLDSAEQLFAVHGIDAVSDRTIADHAGTANHSAVRYYFGDRAGLMEALLQRAVAGRAERGTELLSQLPDPPGIHGLLAAFILPWTEEFASLSVPSYRARYLFQLASAPPTVETGTGFLDGRVIRLEDSLSPRPPELRTVPEEILRHRAQLLYGTTARAMARFEAQLQDGSAVGDWRSLGHFLVDTGAGLLSAPVTDPDDYRTV